MPLIPDPRSQLAKNFREGMDLTDIMPGGMGMAAKMSSPAVDVLSRWIRRFRKDKPPTVPLKNIEKALRHEGIRRGLGPPPRSWEHSAERIYRDPPIQPRRFEGSSPLPLDPFQRPFDHTYLGFKEKPEFDMLHEFMEMLKRMPDKIEKLGGW